MGFGDVPPAHSGDQDADEPVERRTSLSTSDIRAGVKAVEGALGLRTRT
jgi:hypothetical protein